MRLISLEQVTYACEYAKYHYVLSQTYKVRSFNFFHSNITTVIFCEMFISYRIDEVGNLQI